MRPLIALLIPFLSFAVTPKIKIQGSTTVNPVVSEASENFMSKGWQITVDTQGGSSGGISALGENLVQIAMSSRDLNDQDRKKFPKIDFQETVIGFDGVAVVVSKNVFDNGVKELSKQQLIDIYEKKIVNWSAVGGPNIPIVFFNKEPGRGTWEVFANFLYGSVDKTPHVTHLEVGSNEEGKSKVSQTKGGISQLSSGWIKNTDPVRALAIKTSTGKAIAPTIDNIVNNSYPMKRKLSVITNGKPKGFEKEFIDYLTSENGQQLLVKHGYISIRQTH